LIKLVIFDLAGTIVDHGCLSVLESFRELFKSEGIEISDEKIKRYTGLGKLDHLRKLIGNVEEADRLYNKFVPILRKNVKKHSEIIDGVLDVSEYLRSRGIKIGVSTGYDYATAMIVMDRLSSHGFKPNDWICVDQVDGGRPSPWMIFKIMERLRVERVKEVIKVGDTRVDIEAGRNAGCYSSIGVIKSSSLVGLSASEWRKLGEEDREKLVREVRSEYTEATGIIGSIIELVKYV